MTIPELRAIYELGRLAGKQEAAAQARKVKPSVTREVYALRHALELSRDEFTTERRNYCEAIAINKQQRAELVALRTDLDRANRLACYATMCEHRAAKGESLRARIDTSVERQKETKA